MGVQLLANIEVITWGNLQFYRESEPRTVFTVWVNCDGQYEGPERAPSPNSRVTSWDRTPAISVTSQTRYHSATSKKEEGKKKKNGHLIKKSIWKILTKKIFNLKVLRLNFAKSWANKLNVNKLENFNYLQKFIWFSGIFFLLFQNSFNLKFFIDNK